MTRLGRILLAVAATAAILVTQDISGQNAVRNLVAFEEDIPGPIPPPNPWEDLPSSGGGSGGSLVAFDDDIPGPIPPPNPWDPPPSGGGGGGGNRISA